MLKDTQHKVLIVDDEPNIVAAIQFLMEKEGYLVETAYNGLRALEVLNNWMPDVVLLDVMMPEMDGFELAKKIRARMDMDNTRIIFLTAKGASQDKVQGYLSGGEVYLTKPFDNEELIQVVSETVEFG